MVMAEQKLLHCIPTNFYDNNVNMLMSAMTVLYSVLCYCSPCSALWQAFAYGNADAGAAGRRLHVPNMFCHY